VDSGNAANELSYEELARQHSLLINQLSEKDDLVAKKDAEIERLWHQLRELKRHVFGRKSEKLLPEEQSMLFPAGPEKEADLEPAPEVEVKGHKRRNKGRKPLPKDLPRERIEYEPEETVCPCCNEAMAKIGEEITEELDYIPAKFVVREHVRIKRACSRCKEGVRTGVLPPEVQIIEKGRPGVGLLVHIILSKYADHIPLYRQEQIFARHGIELPRQRMCDWVGKIVEQNLLLVAQALKREILLTDYIRADETHIEVQTEKKDRKLHKGYLWGILSAEGDVYFEYDKSRSGEVAEALLGDCKGFIQTDLYPGYNALFEGQATHVGCWDHARRRFKKALESSRSSANKILQQIALLYKIERKIKGAPREERERVRKKKAKPILEKLHKHFEELSLTTLPKSPLGEALSYALSQWKSLVLYLEHGELEISNIAIEQQIRPIAIGRKNWLFAGNERGAKWTACLVSIIATCKLNKINPYDYLCDILKRMPAMNASDIPSLTPRAWATAHNEKL